MALDDGLAILACRAHLATLQIATTGSTSLSATTTGYARAAGSFVTDGFRAGMEITPATFTTTDRQVVKSASALSMTVNGTITADSAATRSITAGQPEYRMYPNMDFNTVQAAGRPYTEEEWLPGPSDVETHGANAIVIHYPTYVIKWWGLSGKGDADLNMCAKKVKAHFAPGTAITMGDGTVLRVRKRPAPFVSQITNPVAGRALVTITIPLWAQTTNDV